MSAGSLLTAGLARAHWMMPRLAGSVHTNMFANTRLLGRLPEDLCPLGATRVELEGVPRVASAYVWGSREPAVLALHGWGVDSTTMSSVMDAARENGVSAVGFDAPGHGASPGSQSTMSEYASATLAVLQRFPSVHTIVAHSMSSIAAASAVAEYGMENVRNLILLAPTCSLTGVIDRWAAERGVPPAIVKKIHRELWRRDGVPVQHWDVRTVGLPPSVRVRILHDPADEVVPFHDSRLIAAEITAEVHEVAGGAGHHRILGSEEMRAALTACLRP